MLTATGLSLGPVGLLPQQCLTRPRNRGLPRLTRVEMKQMICFQWTEFFLEGYEPQCATDRSVGF